MSGLECCCSVAMSMSNSLQPHELQHARLPCPSVSPGVCSNSCPLSHWYYPTISSCVTPFSFCLQSFPASGSLQSWLFASGGQSIRASATASVLPMNNQSWFPLGLTGLIFLKSRGLAKVFSSNTVRKHEFWALSLLVAQMVKCLSTMWETWVPSLGWEDSLEKEMATHSSTLALKIPWVEELGAGYYPWGRKESGTTERLPFHFQPSLWSSFHICTWLLEK